MILLCSTLIVFAQLSYMPVSYTHLDVYKRQGYSRVRVCAQARAIENECFVVIAGSVGNLPRVHNMDIQYAQSGVFTPVSYTHLDVYKRQPKCTPSA